MDLEEFNALQPGDLIRLTVGVSRCVIVKHEDTPFTHVEVWYVDPALLGKPDPTLWRVHPNQIIDVIPNVFRPEEYEHLLKGIKP